MLSKEIRGAILAGAAIVPLIAAQPAMAHVCDSALDQARHQVIAAAEQNLAEANQLLLHMEKLPNGAMKEALVAAVRKSLEQGGERPKVEAIRTVEERVRAECSQQLKPMEDIVSAAVRVALALPTGGLSLIVPERMVHIDMGEILSGNILGGENSIFRQIINKRLGLPW